MHGVGGALVVGVVKKIELLRKESETHSQDTIHAMANLLRFNGRVALVTGAGGGKIAVVKCVVIIAIYRTPQVWGKNMLFCLHPGVPKLLVRSQQNSHTKCTGLLQGLNDIKG